MGVNKSSPESIRDCCKRLSLDRRPSAVKHSPSWPWRWTKEDELKAVDGAPKPRWAAPEGFDLSFSFVGETFASAYPTVDGRR
jgi:hypothetical protein